MCLDPQGFAQKSTSPSIIEDTNCPFRSDRSTEFQGVEVRNGRGKNAQEEVLAPQSLLLGSGWDMMGGWRLDLGAWEAFWEAFW